MQNIIFITTKKYDLPSIQKSLSGSFSSFLYEEMGRRLFVEFEGGDSIQFVQDDSVGECFDDPEEIKALSLLKMEPLFFSVIFRDIEKLKLVLFSVADRSDVLIDNDFGLIEQGNKFIERCKKFPGWDWTKK